MGSKNIKSSETVTLDGISPDVLEDTGRNIGTFEKAVARAAELGELARQTAEESIRISRDAISRAEEVSEQASEIAEKAAEECQQAVDRAKAVSESVEKNYRAVKTAFEEAIGWAE